MGPSVQGLRVFVSIVDHGSFSAAGRELGMSQPAVSNHLHALEERFGVALVARGRGSRTTPAGECLADHARRILSELSALEAAVARHAAPVGRLMVGASSTPGELFLPRLAVGYAESYPEVSLDVHIADTEATLAALLEREVEVAIVGREVSDDRLSERVVAEEELVAVVAAGDPRGGSEVAAEEVAGEPFVLREKGSATRRTVEAGLAGVVEPRVAMELGSNAAVRAAVAGGAGIGVLPAGLVSDGVEPLRLRGINFRRPFVLVFERSRSLSPAAEAFIDTCNNDRGER